MLRKRPRRSLQLLYSINSAPLNRSRKSSSAAANRGLIQWPLEARRRGKRSHTAPAKVEIRVTATTGPRCQVTRCSGSSIGQAIRIMAKLKSIAAAPTIAPAARPSPGAPRRTAHQSTIHGRIALAQVTNAQCEPTLTNWPNGVSVRIWTAKSIRVPPSTKATASGVCHGRDSRPGIAALRAIAARISPDAAKNPISSA